jgi:hypothetical protein
VIQNVTVNDEPPDVAVVGRPNVTAVIAVNKDGVSKCLPRVTGLRAPGQILLAASARVNDRSLCVRICWAEGRAFATRDHIIA